MAPRIAIIGAGMSGICVALKLREAGIEDFTIYEKADQVGGTWRENTYPGLACDVPSRYYAFAFRPNPNWTKTYPPGSEIQDYYLSIVDQDGLRDRIRFGVEIAAARFVDERWLITTADGEKIEADLLVAATGVLHHPKMPSIEGMESFAGAAMHSARWDHSIDWAGKRVGIIGNGSTGVQLVVGMQPEAGNLKLFQRTPQWVIALPNRDFSKSWRRLVAKSPTLASWAYRTNRAVFETFICHAVVEPGVRRRALQAMARGSLRFGIRDRELRRRLTPADQPGCKRLVASSGFYPAIQKPNVELVDDPIERIEPNGIRTADGTLHELDFLVYATGFHAQSYVRPINVVGEDGRSIDQVWGGRPRTYRTVAVPGFANFFLMVGPHSPIGNQSIPAVAEAQADMVVRWARLMNEGRVRRFAPTAEAADAFNDRLRVALPQTVWASGCRSWYLDADGIPVLWPFPPQAHTDLMHDHNPDDFAIIP